MLLHVHRQIFLAYTERIRKSTSSTIYKNYSEIKKNWATSDCHWISRKTIAFCSGYRRGLWTCRQLATLRTLPTLVDGQTFLIIQTKTTDFFHIGVAITRYSEPIRIRSKWSIVCKRGHDCVSIVCLVLFLDFILMNRPCTG